jgi:hypothetical protein
MSDDTRWLALLLGSKASAEVLEAPETASPAASAPGVATASSEASRPEV